MEVVKAIQEEWVGAFEAVQNSELAVEMKVYLRDKFPFYGVPRPERNEILKRFKPEIKKLSQTETVQLVHSLWALPNREMHYNAMDVLKVNQRKLTVDNLKDVEVWLTTNSWWDTVDILASNTVGLLVSQSANQTNEFIDKWIESDNFWLNRTAIIYQLKYKLETDTEVLTQAILPHIHSEEFFIQKAIGWALRQYGKYNPEWVRQFLDEHQLKPLSKREAEKLLPRA